MTRVTKKSTESAKVKERSLHASDSVKKNKIKKHMPGLTKNIKTKIDNDKKKNGGAKKRISQDMKNSQQTTNKVKKMRKNVAVESIVGESSKTRPKVPCTNVVPKLYVRFKKQIKDMVKTTQDLVQLHPDIQNVRLPRKGEKSK